MPFLFLHLQFSFHLYHPKVCGSHFLIPSHLIQFNYLWSSFSLLIIIFFFFCIFPQIILSSYIVGNLNIGYTSTNIEKDVEYIIKKQYIFICMRYFKEIVPNFLLDSFPICSTTVYRCTDKRLETCKSWFLKIMNEEERKRRRNRNDFFAFGFSLSPPLFMCCPFHPHN